MSQHTGNEKITDKTYDESDMRTRQKKRCRYHISQSKINNNNKNNNNNNKNINTIKHELRFVRNRYNDTFFF